MRFCNEQQPDVGTGDSNEAWAAVGSYQPLETRTVVWTIVGRAISTIINPPISVVRSAISISISISIICGGVAAVVGGRIATVVAIAGSGSVIPISRAVCVGSQTGDKGTGD